jgi:hypothetical protein
VVDIDLAPDFSTSNTLIAAARSGAGNYEVWMSTDGGTTFTQVGTSDGAWGSGAGTGVNAWGDVEFSPLFPTDMSIYFAPDGNVTDDDIFRKDLSETDENWDEASSSDQPGEPYSQIFVNMATGSPDGYNLYGVDANDCLFARTWMPITGSEVDDWVDADCDTGSVFGRNGGNTMSGIQYWLIDTAANRIRSWEDSNPYPAGVNLTAPPANGSVPTNTGDNAQPISFNWQDVRDDTDRYRLQIALDQEFVSIVCDIGEGIANCGDADGLITNPFLSLPAGNLGDGVTYWWRVRVEGADQVAGAGDVSLGGVAANPGPWSEARSFTVGLAGAPLAPEISLPLDNSQLPGLSTTISWNNPAGTTQVQIQVTPLNGDGPAINLIIGSPISQYVVPAPEFGIGPYVMLPGATYTTRVRVTRSIDPNITENDSSWGPWSVVRTFTTAPPNSGTIQLLAPINGEVTSDTTPTVQWKDSNTAMFYYEVQMSSDPNFGEAGIVAPVFWNLIHGGETTPENSWTVPDAFAVTPGTYYWRVRQRVQATPAGILETGIPWSPAQSFVVQ